MAILTSATGSPLIEGNTISGFNVGIFAFAGSGGTPQVVDNDVSGTHSVGFTGVGILVSNQDATHLAQLRPRRGRRDHARDRDLRVQRGR